ncbi:MAG: energy transducer TonB [Porticoccus sp.]
MEQALASALAEEEEFLVAENDAQLANSYSAYIFDRVAGNWNRPPSARRGMEVELLIQLVPTGQVVSVMIVQSSGNGAFDRSAEQAVHKAGRFDKLKELPPRVFENYFRKLRLVFRPEDLRL